MTVSNPHEVLAVRSYTTTVELTSDEYFPHPGAGGFRITCFATTAGTLEIDEFDTAGTPRAIRTALAVVANTLLNENFGHGATRVRARFTPSAQPGTVRIEGHYHGYGGSVA